MQKKTTAARTALRAAVTSALVVLVTGFGLQASWADGPAPATGTPATSSAPTPTPSPTTDNNPWD
ncbi:MULTISPECIES: hypothetical protein [Streptomyces]|uniref:Uncharacterized protein n=1 Tax=Streptomyces cinereoruber TaxID=67260 RepID=A0ABX6BMH7_9ACTN|nr:MULTISPECIES: hypothetical protein [Streptomyces]AVH94338.1 hypothetical protein C5L38_04060 [Streptomyces sp. WAC00288]KYG53069.1 hypothetical protein AWI43_00030 [Streptomyces sp. WAC04657]MBB4158105.1 hypothetical protein [Streptomyces cinereoruber]MBY8815998.1 hypothetical protein [Streptomyces cinereoruber]NIH61742.1 hypothetical protein [Streptomyces cinereoruber]